MGISFRTYLFPEEGSPQRLAKRLVEGMVFDADAMPQYANTRQRILTVVLENEEGRPTKILEATGTIWNFDEAGQVGDGVRDAVRTAMDALPWVAGHNNGGTVVSIEAELSRRKLARKYRWAPEQADLDKVAADIWPNAGSDRLSLAQGKAPKRPPLTYEAKHALNEASAPFSMTVYSIQRLGMKSLAGFAFEARSRTDDPDFGPLYEALASVADRQLAILRRRRSSKGIWYAYAHITREELDGTGRVIATYHVRCDGRKKAVAAARRLLAEHAGKFSEDTTVEVMIETDIEWEGFNRDSQESAV